MFSPCFKSGVLYLNYRNKKIKLVYSGTKKDPIVTDLNLKKRSVSAVADNVEVRNIKSVKIKISNSIKFKLFYDRNNSLTKKIKLEQLKKNTG